MPTKKIAFTTLGCRANQYDTAALQNCVEKMNVEIVDFNSLADIYVLNSCAITHEAEREARQQVRKIRKMNPSAVTIVTGCSAQVSSAEWAKTEGVHYVVGNLAKEKIGEIVENICRGRVSRPEDDGRGNRAPTNPIVFLNAHAKPPTPFFGGGVRLPKHTRSFLKIQDGCGQFCSFCIVPFARGLNRSVPKARVLEAMFELAQEGVCEIVLTGIHLGTYGRDLKPRTSLLDLFKEIDEKRPVPRVRISSLDPEEVDDALIDLLSTSDIFCPHLHLPLQSGDDGILAGMNRRYTSAYFKTLADKVFDRIPDLCLGTDVIVGFPGEGEKEFENTERLLEECPIAYIHVFPYSPRKGTRAASFDDPVDEAVKKERVKILRELSVRKRSGFHRRFEGKTLEVVLEKRKRYAIGLTRNYISVQLEKGDLPSGLAEVTVVDVQPENVRGRLSSAMMM